MVYNVVLKYVSYRS